MAVVTGDGLVQISYLHQSRVSHSWHVSMMGLLVYDLGNNRRVIGTNGPIMKRCYAGALVEDRNWITAQFLDQTTHEWVFMIDTDMGFAPDTIDRLLEAADPVERPVVGGLCFAFQDVRHDGMGGMRRAPVPTLYKLAKRDDGRVVFDNFQNYPRETLVQVAGTGAACLLVHRTALETLRAQYGDIWFDQIRDKSGALVGEDLAFCGRLGAAGIPIHVHTGVKTTHHKELYLSAEDYRQPGDVPPALVEPTVVLVPVMRRPANAAHFMASITATSPVAKVYAIADAGDDDTIRAWREAGAAVMIRRYADHRAGTFAEKVNFGAQHTSEPWLFLVGDDVRFAPGWLEQAQQKAHETGAAVIGTNDLSNPRVMAGDHATHLLIARDYIDKFGASWDGPGLVAHEGYRHWFVDDEIVGCAKQRGQWAHAGTSIVEHLHPFWGKADDDDVYQLGQSHAEHDRAVFAERVITYA